MWGLCLKGSYIGAWSDSIMGKLFKIVKGYNSRPVYICFARYNLTNIALVASLLLYYVHGIPNEQIRMYSIKVKVIYLHTDSLKDTTPCSVPHKSGWI